MPASSRKEISTGEADDDRTWTFFPQERETLDRANQRNRMSFEKVASIRENDEKNEMNAMKDENCFFVHNVSFI